MVTVEITAQRAPVNSPLDSVNEIVRADGTRFTTCRPLGSTGSFNQACLNDDISAGLLDSGLQFQVSGVRDCYFFVHILGFRGDARPDFLYDVTITGAN